MVEKKYEFTSETFNYRGHILHRIRALKNFGDVEAGDFGGFIEKEDNLSHSGMCWVDGEAKVFEGALVHEDAYVSGYAEVSGNACVFGHSNVSGESTVSGKARVYTDAQIFDHAKVFDESIVSENALVSGHAKIYGKALVFGNAKVHDFAQVFERAWVGGDALVCEDALVDGASTIAGAGVIKSYDDYVTLVRFCSWNENLTFYRTKNGVGVSCYHFNGTLKEFREMVKKRSKYNKEYLMLADLMEVTFIK